MSLPHQIDDVDVADLSPSAKLVYLTLREEDSLQRTELVARLEIADSTLQYALDQLLEADLIVRRAGYTDGRESRYQTK